MRNELKHLLRRVCDTVVLFSEHASGLVLRRYQREVALAIVDSVIHQKGLTFVVVFPRQSGKNELQAQIEAYLLALYCSLDAELVKVSPTWKPQTLNAMRRLERVLRRNLVVKNLWKKESGYIYRVDRARMIFLSGSPHTNVVGATANVLLECDEAQDVLISKWDKDFAPMAASTNATRVFWGTSWTSRTLLARELRAAQEAQARDGVRRAWVLTADDVAGEVPAYGQFVAGQVQRLGRQHPMVKTQFYSEEMDAQGGMFPERRLALMQGTHPRRGLPEEKRLLSAAQYALLIDVGGEDEHAADVGGDWRDAAAGRDATALTVVEVDLSTLADELLRAPTYRVVARQEWVGARHSALFGALRSLAEQWRAGAIVIDATGVGAGLASFLERAFPGKVIPFVFNQATKSKLGWGFLAVIETGRYREYALRPEDGRDDLQEKFWRQCRNCQMEILEGPEQRMRWAVPDGRRDPETGEVVHDDLVLSAALVAVLDEQEWMATGAPAIVRGRDPLREMDGEGF